jgi:hypothetical protein
VVVVPYGTESRACQTRCWNSVPRGARSRLKTRPLAREVLGELAGYLGERRRVTTPAVADRGREALPGHRYRRERHAAWRGAADEEQFTYRAFHRGVDVHISTL